MNSQLRTHSVGFSSSKQSRRNLLIQAGCRGAFVILLTAGCGVLCGKMLAKPKAEAGQGNSRSEGKGVLTEKSGRPPWEPWEALDLSTLNWAGQEASAALLREKMRFIGEDRSVALLQTLTVKNRMFAALALALEYPIRAEKEYEQLIVRNPEVRIWLLKGLAESNSAMVMRAMATDGGGSSTSFFCLPAVLESDPVGALACGVIS